MQDALCATRSSSSVGEPFDEALYDRSKRDLVEALQEASYARAAVLGNAQRRPRRRSSVRVAFDRGARAAVPASATSSVEGNGDLPATPIRAAAAIEPGTPFSLSALRDARFAIFALGPFASVEIEHQLRAEQRRRRRGASASCPRGMFRFGVGVGMSSGGAVRARRRRRHRRQLRAVGRAPARPRSSTATSSAACAGCASKIGRA